MSDDSAGGSRRKILPAILTVTGLLVYIAVVVLLRCWNVSDVFIDGSVYFVDADCYSRMSRVAETAGGGKSDGHQLFENHPDGIRSHATKPLDWLILILAKGTGSLDLAGAVTGPVLGALAGIFLWWWSRSMRGRWLLLILYAVSPLLVHGTSLGRPDHQGLIILLLTIALGLEFLMMDLSNGHRRRAWASGLAWGGALWVSLYEPLVLLLIVESLRLVFLGRRWADRNRWPVWGGAVVVVALALLVEPALWVQWPDATVQEFFPLWQKSIGELKSLPPWSGLILSWTGLGLLIAPVLLGFAARKDRRAVPVLCLLIIVWALTSWQIRWGYFLVILFLLSVPLQVLVTSRRWVIWTVFVISLWPVAAAWEHRLFPSGEAAMRRAEKRADAVLLQDAAMTVKASATLPGEGVLAPWWLSPSISYWTGLPAVGGSSHQSLPGTVATARFYLTSSEEEAQDILRERQAGWVFAYEPSRVLSTSAILTGATPAPDAMAVRLYEAPSSAPSFLQFVYANQYFKVFRVVEPGVERR